MANIRIKDLPADGAPKQTDLIPIDLGSTRHATVKAVVEYGRPTASKTEAEFGVEPQKAMTPLTTKQAIDAQVGSTYVPKTVKVNAGSGMTGGGELSGDVTVGLTVENVDRLTKVDGIEAGATKNQADSYLLSRANHTGTQDISTVNGLQTALDGKLPVDGVAADSDKLGGETAQEWADKINVGGIYDTKASAEAANIPSSVNAIRLNGYHSAGDGGAALYKRAALEPAHAGKVMSADGAWWELAENIVSAYMFGAREDGSGQDNYTALQSLFDYAVTHPIEKVIVSGNFDISSGLLIKGQVSNCRTFEFSVKLVATSPIDVMLTVEDCGRGFQFPGTIELVGQGGAAVSSRTCGAGLVIRNSARAIFGLIKTSQLIDWGVWMHGDVLTGNGNNNLVNIRGISASLCGSENTYEHTANYSGPVNSGSANSVFQRTGITVSEMPPIGDRIRTACFVDIGGDVYFVDGFDDVNKTISIHPWIDPAVGPTGTLKYIYGGACGTLGGDNGVCVFDFIDGGHCGIVYFAGTAYGNDITQLTAQHSALGVVLGRGLQRTHYSTTINNFYSEALTYDILKLSVETHRVNISGLHETSLSRMRSYRRPRGADGIIPAQPFEGVTLTTDGFNEFFSLGQGLEELSSSKTLGHEQIHVYRMNSWTFNLSLDEAKNSLFGGDGSVLWIFGTGDNNRPTGAFTFNPPSGWTVEGGGTYSLSGFTSQVCIAVKWDFRNKNIMVVLMKGRDGSNYSTTIGIAPVYIGQIAIVSGVAYIATSLSIPGWKAITS